MIVVKVIFYICSYIIYIINMILAILIFCIPIIGIQILGLFYGQRFFPKKPTLRK
jgi:hypothetical protein